MMWGPYGFGGTAWMPFFGILFWLLIFLLGVAAVRMTMGQRHHDATRSQAREFPVAAQPSPGLTILAERYARGEIDRDEYLQKRQDILAPGTMG